MPWPVVSRPSICHLLAFLIFDIFSRTISWIELKLCQHGDSELLKLFFLSGHPEILQKTSPP